MPIAGQPELLGDGRDDRHRAVGGDGQRAVDAVSRGRPRSPPSTSWKSTVLADVGAREARGVRIAVDRDDAQAELLRPCDRPPLMAAGADEEDGLALHATTLRPTATIA